MLQQTQVATVIPYYNRWLRRFPNFDSLAAAAESEVLHAWQGLGYYARARNLHAAAKAVARKKFPTAIDDIRQLPGIGRYTANAIATFAFDQSVPVIEANIARALARLTNLQLPIDSTSGREALWNFAAALVPKRNAARFNSALMDFGATVCTARQPKCEICPVRTCCSAQDPALASAKTRTTRAAHADRATHLYAQARSSSSRTIQRPAGAACGSCRVCLTNPK